MFFVLGGDGVSYVAPVVFIVVLSFCIVVIVMLLLFTSSYETPQFRS